MPERSWFPRSGPTGFIVQILPNKFFPLTDCRQISSFCHAKKFVLRRSLLPEPADPLRCRNNGSHFLRPASLSGSICIIFVPALEFPVFRDLRQTIQTVIPVCIVPAFFDGEAFCFGCKCGCTAFLRIGSVFLCCHNVFFLYSFFRQIKQMVFAP